MLNEKNIANKQVNGMADIGKLLLDAYKNSDPEQKNMIIKVIGIMGLVGAGIKAILMLK